MEKDIRCIREAEQIARMYHGVPCENDGFFEYMERLSRVEQRDIEENARRKMANIDHALQLLSNDLYYSDSGEDGSVLVNKVFPDVDEHLTLVVNLDLLEIVRGMRDAQWEYSNFFVSDMSE